MKTTLLFLSVFLSASLFSQNVYIPDVNFKACLVTNPEINTNGDYEIQVSEATAYDGHLYCPSANFSISDLTGVEAFTALTALTCNSNQLTSLDVSNNTALEILGCSDNQLTSLDVSQNTALQSLHCGFNQLTSLDVSQNTALEILACSDNQLTSLDLSQNTALEHLYGSDNQLTSLDVSQNIALAWLICYDNQLTSIDLSQNTALERLFCNENQLTCLNLANGNNINFIGSQFSSEFSAVDNPNLTCIEVDDAEFSTALWGFWFYIDPQTSFSEDCNNDCTSSLTEITTSKNLIKILDMMGRETTFKPNTHLIYVYDDGSTEKVFSVEY